LSKKDRVRTPEPIGRIVKLFRIQDVRARSLAARLVGQYASHKMFLHRRLQEEDGRVRANVIESIGDINSEDVRSALMDALKDRHHRVRTNAIVALHRLGYASVSSLLLDQSRHRSPAFRAAAAWAMGEIGNAEFAGALMSLSGDDDKVVRDNAARALARLQAPTIRPEIALGAGGSFPA
jgi:HEAT repeat protein